MSSQALVLLPGLLCDHAVWQHQVSALQDDYACQIIDYGCADSLPAMAKIALDQAPAQFALAGHSMGGRVALEVMRQAPERVTRLALLDTGYEARPAGEAGNREAQKRLALVEQARQFGLRAMGEHWLVGMVLPAHLHQQPLRGAILDMIERKSLSAYEAQIRALLNRPDTTELLGTITCPTQIVCARHDEWSPLSRHQQLARLIPGSVLAVIEDSGHMCTMEQPAQVTAVLNTWLRHETPPAAHTGA